MNQHVTFAKQDHRPWEAVEYEILCKMARAGKTDDDIGAMLGRPRRAIMDARGRLGLVSLASSRPWTDDDTKTLTTLFLAGRTDEEIAQTLGRSRDAVIGKRKNLGINANSRYGDPLPASTAPKVLAADILYQRPCPINAEYKERVHANAAYLLSAIRAGHPVYPQGRGPE